MKINHVIKTLVLSDFFVNAGFSVFAPVFAIFVTQQIQGGSLQVVGFAAAIVQIAKITLEIPIAKFLDKNHGEYDDFYSLILGSFLIAMVPFLYLIATEVKHVYLISALYGTGIAFIVPPWYAIFSRHIDKLRESFEWSLDSVAIGLAAAGAAAAGGILAQKFGFNFVFLIGGIFAIFGGLNQIKIYKDLKEKVGRGQVMPQPDKQPPSI
ncbi:MAG: MFS transporter [Candidatus Yanofskybacteria bacterium]|nr:MFS transporter [Candidatus Yanofskybacteria bacterium]